MPTVFSLKLLSNSSKLLMENYPLWIDFSFCVSWTDFLTIELNSYILQLLLFSYLSSNNSIQFSELKSSEFIIDLPIWPSQILNVQLKVEWLHYSNIQKIFIDGLSPRAHILGLKSRILQAVFLLQTLEENPFPSFLASRSGPISLAHGPKFHI